MPLLRKKRKSHHHSSKKLSKTKRQQQQQQQQQQQHNDASVVPHDAEEDTLLSRLMTELAFLIFSFLDPVDLCRCSSVSKAWYTLASHDLAWEPRCKATKLPLPSLLAPERVLSYKDVYKRWFLFKKAILIDRSASITATELERGHSHNVRSTTQDDNFLFSGSRDGYIKAWSTHDLSLSKTWENYNKNRVASLQLVGDGVHLLSGSDDGRICTWNIHTMELESWFFAHNAVVLAIAKLEKGKKCHAIYSSGRSRYARSFPIKAWKVTKNAIDGKLSFEHFQTINTPHGGDIVRMEMDKTRNQLFTTSEDRKVKVWAVNTDTFGLEIKHTINVEKMVSCLWIDQELGMCYGGCIRGAVLGWDLNSFEEKKILDHAHDLGVESILVVDNLLLTGGRDCLVNVFDISQNYKHIKSIHNQIIKDGERLSRWVNCLNLCSGHLCVTGGGGPLHLLTPADYKKEKACIIM